MTKPPLLSEDQRATFATDGVLVLPGFYDPASEVEPVQRGIHDVIGQVMARHGITDDRPSYQASEFDAGYAEVIALNRSYGGEVYDAVKQIPAFMRLVTHPANEQVVRELRRGCVPGLAAGGYGIRIDNPGEDRFRAQWHQEYPAQLRSLDGVVFWSPLVPITADLGPVTACLGSHREGAVPVRVGTGGGRQGAYALELHEEAARVARYRQEAPLTVPGDLILLDFLLLHASGHNRAQRSRWSMQFRYFNFAEATGRGHGWQGSYAAGVDFRVIHPELCVE
jgi:Phytanoyl-CoA dioxygenase (PhyH)